MNECGKYILRWNDGKHHQKTYKSEPDGLIARLAFQGIPSVMTDVRKIRGETFKLETEFDAFSDEKFLMYFTQAQLDEMKSWTEKDLDDWGYTWFKNLEDGDEASIAEMKEFLDG